MDPTLITAIATLVTAIGGLIAVLKVGKTTSNTNETVHEVHLNTNGRLTDLQSSVETLKETQATPEELAARIPKASP